MIIVIIMIMSVMIKLIMMILLIGIDHVGDDDTIRRLQLFDVLAATRAGIAGLAGVGVASYDDMLSYDMMIYYVYIYIYTYTHTQR